MRAFVAVSLPAPLVEAIAAFQARVPVGRPVPENNLHLTLAFLGDQPQSVLEDFHEALASMTAASFPLHLKGLDVMGGAVPKVLCLRADPDPALMALHDRVRNAARLAGISLERRRFRPHVTIARFRAGQGAGDGARLRKLLGLGADVAMGPYKAHSFGLYESVLMPDRAVHHLLADYPLPDFGNPAG